MSRILRRRRHSGTGLYFSSLILTEFPRHITHPLPGVFFLGTQDLAILKNCSVDCDANAFERASSWQF
jgi:hypothetical protein